jgi:hypothetical protein
MLTDIIRCHVFFLVLFEERYRYRDARRRTGWRKIRPSSIRGSTSTERLDDAVDSKADLDSATVAL